MGPRGTPASENVGRRLHQLLGDRLAGELRPHEHRRVPGREKLRVQYLGEPDPEGMRQINAAVPVDAAKGEQSCRVECGGVSTESRAIECGLVSRRYECASSRPGQTASTNQGTRRRVQVRIKEPVFPVRNPAAKEFS